MESIHRRPAQAGLAVMIMALLLTTQANATGVCLVCPPGHTCSGDSVALGGTAGQVLIREGTSTAWKSVVDVALQGNRGPQGATGATGPRGPQGATGSNATWVYDHTQIYGIMGACSKSNSMFSMTATETDHKHCWCCKYKLNGTGSSTYAFVYSYDSASVCRTSCPGMCTEYPNWLSLVSW